jgi:site-specific recombinase XerD
MLELMNIRFTFLCRATRRNENDQSPIILRIIYRGERRDTYTGLYCSPVDWDTQAGKVFKTSKTASTLNKNLDLIIHRAHQAFDNLRFSGNSFTIDELVDKLKGKEQKPALMVEYLEMRNEELKDKIGIDITGTTHEKYERSLRYVIDFLALKCSVKNYPLARIDGKFLEKYYQYLRVDKKIANNTAVKYLTAFRTVLMPAIRSRLIPQDPFKEVKFKTKVIHKGFLTDEEINLLTKVKLSEDLGRIRDQYLFCCYTGLAYSDLKQLNREHFIQQKDDEYYILKPRQKTGQQSIIPLLPAARQILQKYSPTRDFRDFIWHVSANQKMNQRLKVIGEKGGLSKMLHMHLARHTFATTITLSNGVPIETVSSMLGHASLRQTQHYAKIVAMKVIKDMAGVKAIYN